jgi:HSP90 family molecular chaperone
MTDKNKNEQSVQLNVDIAGLIEIFGEALYDEFGATVKELIQNAHDAITKKYVENGEIDVFKDKIIVKFDESTRSLVVYDTGVGMDKNDLINELNNFAKSRKRELQKQIVNHYEIGNPRNLQIIGEYGVGFLSALAAGDDVTIWSKKKDERPLSWRYEKGESKATITTALLSDYEKARLKWNLPESKSGTILICVLTAETVESYYIDQESIRNSVIKYASILPIHVYFENELISCKYRAWNNNDIGKKSDWEEYIKDKTDSKPLLVIPIYSPPDELDLQGVLWIPPRSFIQEHSSIEIYIKRMYVMEDFNQLLPEWAKFINGVINSNKIRRIVSGTVFKIDANSSNVKDFIADRIIEEFNDIHQFSDENYWKIIGPHDDTIKESAAEYPEFLESVWDKLFIHVRNQKFTIVEYSNIIEKYTGFKNTLFYYDKPHQEFSANQVSDSTGVPVLSLCSRQDYLFIKAICDIKPYQLKNFNELADQIFKIPDDSINFDSLIKACALNSIMAEIRHYEPSHIPAMLVQNDNINELREGLLRKVKKLKDFGIKDFDDYDLEGIERMLRRGNVANAGVSFYLNASSDLVQLLAKAPFETQSSICSALFHISYMSAMPTLGKSEVHLIFNSITTVLKSLINTTLKQFDIPSLSEAEPIEATENKCLPIRIFMMTPFKPEYRKIELAVKKIFESEPYFFEVTLARDVMLDNKKVKSIKSHIKLADAYIAEISELNENVMMELGAVHFSNEEEKPVFALKNDDAKNTPSDFSDNIYIEYGSINDDVTDIIEKIKKAIEKNGNPSSSEILKLINKRTCKALNGSLLTSLRFRFNVEEEKNLLKNFKTVEEFLDTDNLEISRRINIKENAVILIKDEINDLLNK